MKAVRNQATSRRKKISLFTLKDTEPVNFSFDSHSKVKHKVCVFQKRKTKEILNHFNERLNINSMQAPGNYQDQHRWRYNSTNRAPVCIQQKQPAIELISDRPSDRHHDGGYIISLKARAIPHGGVFLEQLNVTITRAIAIALPVFRIFCSHFHRLRWKMPTTLSSDARACLLKGVWSSFSINFYSPLSNGVVE